MFTGKANKPAVLISAIIICVTMLTGCNMSYTSENPDNPTSTEETRPHVMLNLPVFETVKDMMKWAEGVVIASFKEDPAEVSVYLPHELQEAEITDTKPGNFSVTKYTLSVEKVIAGDVDGGEITLSLFGRPGDPGYEAELKSNTPYLLLLSKRDYEEELSEAKTEAEKLELDTFFEKDKILYQLLNSRYSVFEILEDDTLLPYAATGFSADFDGKPLESLISEIKAAAGE